MPNQLIHETSPYLLQHAHNPVQWYAWGTEALQKAKEADKPILVSIGYAACHWCHVMERESFEDEATAAIMNEHFINIKIDREERPDLDHIYMDAVQAMTGSGGWPLNVFLTPDKTPFYGGTYFPPQTMMNRPSWKETLLGVAHAFATKREEIERQAEQLTGYLLQANQLGTDENKATTLADRESVDVACANLLKAADTAWGGFGNAPKFPQTFSIQFLIRYYYTQQQRTDTHSQAALQHALLSLSKMLDGGIYDQLGGGFARYATDKEWLIPHFEKMLYDNALLVAVLSEAYQLTKQEKYKNAIVQTLAFAERELMHPLKGFYAALDADSEGEEGRFYVWEYTEVKELLGSDADVFCQYYNISEAGNWEGKNILRVLQPLSAFASAHHIPVADVEKILRSGKEKLMHARSLRKRPALDDKIILGWNALMNTAYSKAYAATGIEAYRQTAIDNMEFLWYSFSNKEGGFHHVWKNNVAKYPAFLDDYAYLIQALLQLHTITGNTAWLEKAKQTTQQVIDNFSETTGYFYYTPQGQQDVIVRKKEVYDGATPSGNAVMAQNLYELGLLLDEPVWTARCLSMLKGISHMAIKYPTSFGAWLTTMLQVICGTQEVVLLGRYEAALPQLLLEYLPHTIIMAAHAPNCVYPLLQGKLAEEELTLYWCKNYTCRQPVFSVKELITMMQESK